MPRQDEHEKSRWRTWLLHHRENLERWGIPAYLLKTSRHWAVFLEHGYDEQSGWSVWNLDHDSAAQFYEFLDREFGEHRDDWYQLSFAVLTKRLGLSNAQVLQKRLSAVAERLELASAEVYTTMEFGEGCIKLWLHRGPRAWVLEAPISGMLRTFEMASSPDVASDAFEFDRLADASGWLLEQIKAHH